MLFRLNNCLSLLLTDHSQINISFSSGTFFFIVPYSTTIVKAGSIPRQNDNPPQRFCLSNTANFSFVHSLNVSTLLIKFLLLLIRHTSCHRPRRLLSPASPPPPPVWNILRSRILFSLGSITNDFCIT